MKQNWSYITILIQIEVCTPKWKNDHSLVFYQETLPYITENDHIYLNKHINRKISSIDIVMSEINYDENKIDLG